jgi:hypothetical protein
MKGTISGLLMDMDFNFQKDTIKNGLKSLGFRGFFIGKFRV